MRLNLNRGSISKPYIEAAIKLLSTLVATSKARSEDDNSITLFFIKCYISGEHWVLEQLPEEDRSTFLLMVEAVRFAKGLGLK